MTRREAAIAAGLFAWNLWIAWDLVGAGYTRNMQSNEGAFLAVTKAFAEGRLFSWWPQWNLGQPIQHTYAPGLPMAAAVGVRALDLPPVRAYHVASGVLFSLGAVALYLFSRSAAAAILWTLVSPSAFLTPIVRGEMDGWLHSRRLHNILHFGEAAHVVSVSLLPLVAWTVHRAWSARSIGWHAAACAAMLATALMNAFGAASALLVALAMFAAEPPDVRRFALRSGAAMAAVVAILASPWMPVDLLLTVARNSLSVGRGYAPEAGKLVAAVAMGIVLMVVARWLAAPVLVRFAVLLSLLCAGLALPSFWWGFDLVFQSHRYQHEMDLAVCLLLGLLAPRPVVWALLVAAIPQSIHIKAQLSRLAQPVDIEQTIEHRVAREFERLVPGRRVMASGSVGLWLNAFTDQPQLSGGHDPMAINPVQRFAVFAIHTGMNAGDRDAEVSLLWLRAFGVSAVSVHGPGSTEYWKPFARPGKFDGLLPVLWREGPDTIYAVPGGVASLSHVVPESALVRRVPKHGLDVDDVRRYVDALGRAADEQVLGPNHIRIRADVGPGEAITVQRNFHRGWRASGAQIGMDGLGLIVLRTESTGVAIDLRFE